MTAITTGQEYYTNSGLLLKFGTDKAIVSKWGEYVVFGPNRIIEGVFPLLGISTTAATPTILSDVVFFPSLAAGQLFIEKVELVAETGAVGGTSFNVGLIQLDRSTIPTNYGTAFVNAEVTATLDTAGKAQTYLQNTTHAGGLIGSSAASATGPYYITGYATGTYSAGSIRFRVFYHALDAAITQ